MIHSEIIFENGFAKLKINGEKYPFAAYRSFHPQEKYVGDFYKHGFRIFNVFPSGIMTALADRTIPYSQFGAVWTGENEYNWDNFKKQTDLFNKECPGGYAALMIHLDTPEWFLKKYPSEGDTWESFVQGAASERWRTAAEQYMCALMDKADELMPGKIYGYFLMAGGTTEWYTRNLDAALENPTESQLEAYRRFKGDMKALPPSAKEFSSVQDKIFTTDKNVLDYRRFLNTLTAETLSYFAEKAKRHCKNERVVCSFFGYVGADCANIVRYSYNETQKIYADKNINAITAPASYNFRKLNSTSAFRIAVDSLILHNKLYIHEIDSKTHLTHKNKLANTHMSGIDDTFNTLEETTAYLRREVGMTLAKGQGFWLFDMFGGWFDAPDMMHEIESLHKLADKLAETDSHSMSETALLVDLESDYHVGEDADYPVNELQIREMNKCGFPWDMYITDDLCCERFDINRYKLFIFPNLFYAKPEICEKIKLIRSMGKSILFLHAPGVLSNNTEDLTGMKLKAYPYEQTCVKTSGDGKIFDFSHEVNVWRQMRNETREKNYLNPVFSVDEPCEVPGHYVKDGSTAIGIKERGGFDAYSAIAPLDAELVKKIADRAGIFRYAENAIVYLNSAMLTVYSADGGNVNLRWNYEVKIKDYFSGEEYILNKSGTDIRFKQKETKIFLVMQR